MSWYHPSTLLDKIFEGGIIIKGVGGTIEFLSGLLLFFVSPASLHHFVLFISEKEIFEGPHDIFANFLTGWASHFDVHFKVFLIAYLWVHAATKLIAVIGILRNLLWAYPFSLITLGIMMVYQLYEVIRHHSIFMAILTVFDIGILWLIWREYGKVRQTLAHKKDKVISEQTGDGTLADG